MLKAITPDLEALSVAAKGIAPGTYTSTQTGAGVDLLQREQAAFGVLNVGTVSGTSPTLDVKYQESDDNSTGWADITGATHAQVTATDKYDLAQIIRSKRYVRAVGTIAGTTPSFAFGVTILGLKKGQYT